LRRDRGDEVNELILVAREVVGQRPLIGIVQLESDCAAVEPDDDEHPASSNEADAKMPRPTRRAAAWVEVGGMGRPFGHRNGATKALPNP
jgi:hypothetical protein